MKKLRELLGSKKNSSGTQAKKDTQARSDAQAESKREISNRIGPKVLFDGAKELNLGVDVVFVHGLRGSSHGTWSKGDICWPRDLLREDMPNNRIITWGYDSNVANANTYASAESIYGHAETLLGDLCRIRQGIVRYLRICCSPVSSDLPALLSDLDPSLHLCSPQPWRLSRKRSFN